MTTRIHIKLTVLLALLSMASPVRAEIPDPPEPTESAVAQAQAQGQWIQQMQIAGNLLADGKPAEALDRLQTLQRDLPSLDADGLVALAIGDCHMQLRQYEQALAVYQQAAQMHPALNDTIWARLADVEAAMGKTDAAAARLQSVMASDASPEYKAWAAERLAAVQEQQAIQALQQAEAAYRKASALFEKLSGPSGAGRAWTNVHADDLKDATAQLGAAMKQRQNWDTFLPSQWSGPSDAPALPNAEVNKTRISGLIEKPEADGRKLRHIGLRPARTSVELSLEKDKLEITIDGHKVELDPLTRRQVVKHLQYALRIAGQKGNQELEQKQLSEDSARLLEKSTELLERSGQ